MVADIISTNVSVPKSSQTQSGGFDGGFKSHLDSLLTAGTITQVQEDAITAALKTAVKGPDGDKTALDALVTAGTITQAQEDAIQTVMTASRGAFNKGPNAGEYFVF